MGGLLGGMGGVMTDKQMETLVKAVCEGKVKIESIHFNACGKCKVGTMKSNPTPTWMNRWICDKCGHKANG